MRTVWKYTLPTDSWTFTITMPANAEPIRFGTQAGKPVMWCIVDPEQPDTERPFAVVPTGGNVPPGARHVGTILVMDEQIVWHLFDCQEATK